MEDFYRRVAAEHLPGKRFRTLCLPLWCGAVIGACSTLLANLLNLGQPLWDPTLYALHSVSRNLDFSPAFFEFLERTMPNSLREREEENTL